MNHALTHAQLGRSGWHVVFCLRCKQAVWYSMSMVEAHIYVRYGPEAVPDD